MYTYCHTLSLHDALPIWLLVARCDECDRDDDPGHGAGPHRRAQSPGRLAAAAFERRRAAAAAAVFGGRRPQFLVHSESLGDRALPADRPAPVGADRREPVGAAYRGAAWQTSGLSANLVLVPCLVPKIGNAPS